MQLVTKSRDDFVAEDQALQLLVSGKSLLSKVQDRPPFEVIDFLKGRFEDLKSIGPSTVKLKALGRLSEKLVRDGRRQSLVDELHIEWLTRRELGNRYRRIVFGNNGQGTDLYDQVLACWNFHLETRAETVLNQNALPEEDVRKRALFLLKKGSEPRRRDKHTDWLSVRNDLWTPSDEPWIYKRVGEDWLQYWKKLTGLWHSFEGQVAELLSEGCVLCVEETQNTARLLSPQEASKQQRSGRGQRIGT